MLFFSPACYMHDSQQAASSATSARVAGARDVVPLRLERHHAFALCHTYMYFHTLLEVRITHLHECGSVLPLTAYVHARGLHGRFHVRSLLIPCERSKLLHTSPETSPRPRCAPPSLMSMGWIGRRLHFGFHAIRWEDCV